MLCTCMPERCIPRSSMHEKGYASRQAPCTSRVPVVVLDARGRFSARWGWVFIVLMCEFVTSPDSSAIAIAKMP
jgi:hypothetical protein